MRVIHLVLLAYFGLLAGMLAALWRSGVLARIDGAWAIAGGLALVALGVLGVLTAAPRAATVERK